MTRYFFCMLLALCFNVLPIASEVADFKNIKNNKDVTFFLSTPKSGTNLITGCLSVITRRPISWFYWGKTILDPASINRNHISYNRLGLDLISDLPLLYRTHYQFEELLQVPSEKNKLIFATRNPKELLYRKFFLQHPRTENPDWQFVEEFLHKYLQAFEVYEAWYLDTKMIVFYEDFIINSDEMLFKILEFMNEPPLFLEDFLTHKQDYLTKLLQSYSNQHTHNNGGVSSKGGPKSKYYTLDASPETLKSIDEYLQKRAPQIWEKYLKRYVETE